MMADGVAVLTTPMGVGVTATLEYTHSFYFLDQNSSWAKTVYIL
jgi:hypothetical protein